MSGSRSILDDVVVTPVALMPALPDGYGPSTTLSRQILTPTGRNFSSELRSSCVACRLLN